jgi:signal transduction histidine kinase
MHDSLGQYLSALKMKIGTLRVTDQSLGEATTAELESCGALLDECVKEVRTISYLLYPPMLEEMGLKTAISWYLDGFTQRSGIKTSLEVAADFHRTSRDIELALFRVIQEALTNVIKHSGSAKVDIRLSRQNDKVSLEIRDYGKGLSSEMLNQSSRWTTALGVGLRGMNERIRQLGGELTVSAADPGTVVCATVPMESDSIPANQV